MIQPVTFSIKIDRSNAGVTPIRDEDSQQVAVIPRGNPAKFRIGIFNESLPLDLSNVTSINLRAQPSQTENSPVIDQSIPSTDDDFTNLITLAGWEAKTEANAVIELTGSQTNIDLSEKNSRTLYLVITAFRDNEGVSEEVTLGMGSLTIVEDNNAAADPPPENPGTAATLDDLNAAISGNTSNLSSTTPQSFSAAQKQQLADNWPEAVEQKGEPSFVRMPRMLSKLYDLNRITFQGTDHNFLTLFNLADSMGLLGFYPHLENILQNKLGMAGLGFDRLIYKNTAGTVNFPNDEAPVGRRFDLWGFGTCMQIESGGVLEIGEPFSGDQVRAFQCTKATFFLATEPGGGTVDIEYYNDSTPGWETLETGISTDAPTGALIKTYTFTERSVIFRVTGTSGNTELIGALLRNVAHHGLVSCQSAIGGNPLTTINTGDTGIFNAVMAEVAPDLIISQYDEPAAGLEAAFGTYADAVEAAAPNADHLYWTEHEIDNTGGKEANHWPVYQAKADTLENLRLFEAETVLPYSMITACGWDDPDAVHLDPGAWYYVAGVLAWSFGMDPAYGNQEFVKVAQTGSTKIWRLGGITLSGTLVYEIRGFQENSTRQRFAWEDPENGERWWEVERKPSADPDNPEGFSLNFNTSVTSGEAINANNAGRLYFGPSANINFDGRGTFFETWSARGCVVTAHSGGATASLLKGYTDMTLSTVAYDVKTTGVARFKTLNTADWATAADDTAAASAGVAVGEAYKTAAGELRVRIA